MTLILVDKFNMNRTNDGIRLHVEQNYRFYQSNSNMEYYCDKLPIKRVHQQFIAQLL